MGAQAFEGEMSADGAWLAYQEIGLWDPEWRNYRGGQAQPVSVVSTSTWERRTPPWEGERHLAPGYPLVLPRELVAHHEGQVL